MLLAATAIVVGVVVLAFAADQFVIGASRVALLRRMSPLVVGVVVIGFGTSVPEMLVSVLAVLGDEAEVGIGNVVGSNLANLSLLLGVGALLVPLRVASLTVRREAPLVVAAVLAFGLAVQGGGIGRYEGILLLIGMAGALIVVSRSAPSDPLGTEVEELVQPSAHRFAPEVVRTVVGLVATAASAQLLLWGALRAADEANLSAGFVGATLVAVGTSLPELVTVIQSARRNETDLIVGNLLGSNLFNALAVGGLIGVIGGSEIDNTQLTTLAVVASVVVALTATIAMRTRHVVSRVEGSVLVVGYLVLLPFLS